MADGLRMKPFDGSTDFAMWKIKMKAVLIKEKCWAAVSQNWPADTSDLRKQELQEIAHSEIMIRLADDVVRQVGFSAHQWCRLSSALPESMMNEGR
ncbi:hypothetical protein LINPERPRIM_LOCUS15765 [Linum perenne]